MTVKKKTEVVIPEAFIQFQGKEEDLAAVYDRVREAFAEEEAEKTEIKSLKVYIKPEENAAYYVINESFAGRVDLFV